MHRRTVTALVTSGALALGGVALLVPQQATAAPDQAVSQVSSAVGSAGVGARLGRRLLTPAQRRELRSTGHVTVTLHTPKHGVVTVLVQRGEVTALSPTSISLRSVDGYTHTYVVTDKTKVRERGVPVSYTDLTVGERAMVVALKTDQGDVARRIGCLRPAAGTGSPTTPIGAAGSA